MSSDKSYVNQIVKTLVTEETEDRSTPYVIMIFPDGILFTATADAHKGLMKLILCEEGDSGGAYSDLNGISCMLIRTEKTENVMFKIRDCLMENYASDHHIFVDDMSHNYDSIDGYISDTRNSNDFVEDDEEYDEHDRNNWDYSEEEYDEHDPSNWDNSVEEDDDDSDWDDEDENY